tara:strand:+ start:3082 stop:3408 length:327 start_codon:yes stop_codon:yes gene_type:complete
MRILAAMLMGVLAAQDLPLGESRQPIPKTEFELLANHIPPYLRSYEGRIIVEFFVNESGKVEDPQVTDSFNVALNDVVLDKVRKTTYLPALQNGRPVKVKYMLPIQFK